MEKAEAFKLEMNTTMATWLREAMAKRESSWDDHHHRYRISEADAAQEVVGDNPIAKVIECLLVAGYSETWDFCDEVLGRR